MMKTQTLTVDILPDGTVTIDVDGVEGKQCLDLTRGLEEKLGKNTERKMKDQSKIANMFTSKKLEVRK